MIDYNKDVIYNGHIYKVKDILFEALVYGYSNNTKKNSYISWIFYRRYSYAKLLLKIIGYNKDINSLYREATKEEMDTFFQMEIISVDQQFTTNKIGMLNRKNIALILETYNSYDADVKKELHSYIDNLNLPKNGDGKYIIDNDKNLKNYVNNTTNLIYLCTQIK